MNQNLIVHRPAMAWLTDLQKAKADGSVGHKPKVTIQDLMERINDPNAQEQMLIPSSPRSVEACFRLGLDPVELQFHPWSWYKRKDDVDDDVTKHRYERYEAVRQERLRSLINERKNLIDENWQSKDDSRRKMRQNDSRQTRGGSAMLDKERNRLEVLKRRQERELNQMVQHELSRQEILSQQQKRIEEQERRAAEQTRLKLEHEAARMAKHREIELQKLAEERENERRARIMAEEHYRHARKLQYEREESDRQLRNKAFHEDMERRHKAEEARKETEAILAAQAEEFQARRMEMERRDAERMKRIEQELKEKHAQNMVKRKKAEERISSALAQNAEIMRNKRAMFMQKEAEAEARRKEMEAIHAREELLKRDEELRKQQERQEKYQHALMAEEFRKMSVKQRAEERERIMGELYSRRKKEQDLKKVEADFQLKLRMDKVDSMQKTRLYQRQQLLGKIMSEYDKTRQLLRERQELQEDRKTANMASSMQRQLMMKTMESMRTKNFNGMSNTGSIDVSSLMKKSSRPSTAL